MSDVRCSGCCAMRGQHVQGCEGCGRTAPVEMWRVACLAMPLICDTTALPSFISPVYYSCASQRAPMWHHTSPAPPLVMRAMHSQALSADWAVEHTCWASWRMLSRKERDPSSHINPTTTERGSRMRMPAWAARDKAAHQETRSGQVGVSQVSQVVVSRTHDLCHNRENAVTTGRSGETHQNRSQGGRSPTAAAPHGCPGTVAGSSAWGLGRAAAPLPPFPLLSILQHITRATGCTSAAGWPGAGSYGGPGV